jgi:hypothetical protein
MLQLIQIATLSAALSAGMVTADSGAPLKPPSGEKAFYDRLPQAGARDDAGLLRILAPSNPRA